MKKVLSLFLSIVMLLSITAGIDLESYAASVTGSQIVSYARSFIGCSYVKNGKGPTSFDCSGFVCYVFNHFGISLPSTSSDYWNNPTNYGTVVATGSIANAQAGDVISWSKHVAIYTENGYCVEALNSTYGVCERFEVDVHTNGTNYRVIRINGVTSGSSDTTKPTISNVSVSVTTTGFKVSCSVTDNVGVSSVRIPVWTSKNGQDDLVWYTASKSGNNYSYTVKISNHNNEIGTYYYAIYAYDAAGNSSTNGNTAVKVTNQTSMSMVKSTVYNGRLYASFNNPYTYHDSVYSSYFQLAEVTNSTINSKVASLISSGSYNHYLIGNVKSSNTWKTKYTGTTLSYLNWSTGEPDNQNNSENIVAMRKTDGKWVDTSYSNTGIGFVASASLSITPAKTVYYGNNKYTFYNNTMPYTFAKAYCEAKGGHLATITSSGENTTVKNMINSQGVTSAYIGANDISKEGTFTWVTGESMSYTNWSSGEPNNYSADGGQDYVRMYASSGKWDDTSDENAKGEKTNNGFVCEYDGKLSITVNTSSTASKVTASDVKTYLTFGDSTKKSVSATITVTDKGNSTYLVTAKYNGLSASKTVSLHTHDYEVYSQVKATTSSNGKIVYLCSDCNTTKTQIVLAIGDVTLSESNYIYDGKVHKPSVTVSDVNGNKINSKYYTVTYSSGCKSVNTYTVTIKFKGNYKGTKTLTYTIKPKSTSISKITAKSRGFQVTWKKVTKQTTGYQIQYATNKKFTKNKKTVTVKKNTTTSKTIKSLKAKKKYYVRVRTYKTINGKKYYSSWSKTKTVTTKK